jgi:4-amino-4-deoxy-L-arabinose transferase-like glycosyltransferase
MSPRSVVFVAVLLRVGWVLAVPTRPVGDFAMYLESAVHLFEHRALDPEFVYMPGYVGFAAGLMALGAGLLTIKLVVAVLAGLATGAVYGIGAALWDRRAGLAAAWGYALWPAGIAVTSVTGTDMPTAILVVTAVFVLTHWGGTRPWLAAIGFGLVMGVAATVRAVAVPLAGFSVFYFLATSRIWAGGRLRRYFVACLRAGVATAVALAVLSPWAVRNHRRYGEWFITDSHGGLTALVGANPNSDGRYSRSLNLMFKEVSGYTLLAEPHREADHASYELAREVVAFSPAYAAGLVVEKAERLLTRQRPLLYWPVYRAGVLQPGGVKNAFDSARRFLEPVVDAFWWGLVGLFFVGVGLAIARRRWDALWFVPMAVALIGIYALFFAEARYQLPIVILMFPIAGGGLVFLPEAAAHIRRLRRIPRGLGRELAWALAALLFIAALIPGAAWAGSRLVEAHRFAIHVLDLDGRKVLGKWRPDSAGPSPVQGVWDGVGVRLARRDAEGRAAARTEIELPAGRYLVRAAWDAAPPDGVEGPEATDDVKVVLRVNDQVVEELPLATLLAAGAQGQARPIEAVVEHAGGPLRLLLEARGTPAAVRSPATAVWLSRLSVRKAVP